MIIRIEVPNGYRIFDNVTEFQRHFKEADDASGMFDHVFLVDELWEQPDLSGFTATEVQETTIVVEDARVSFVQNGESWYVLTKFPIYVMNDDGKTIDRI
jgi:hypothetical protein